VGQRGPKGRNIGVINRIGSWNNQDKWWLGSGRLR
jgi:hypothetical protein